MEFDQIKELIKLLQETTISEFKYESTEMSLSIRTKDYHKIKEVVMQGMSQMPMQMQPTAQPVATETTAAPVVTTAPTDTKITESADSSNYIEIKSPMVGTFYRSSTPEKPPFVKVGDTIGPDSNVCLIEAMKLFNDVKAEVSGKIVKVMVEDASPVEYEQVLFLVEPA
jgi:acetyl-CoA carboxylase biotin carboxyl carrier protein